MANRTGLNLDVDLRRGVVPISKAASSLAALIKRASATGRPVIVTQKGYPTGVLLPIELFSALKALVTGESDADSLPVPKTIDEIIDSLEEGDAPAEDGEPAAPTSRPRRRKRAEEEPVAVEA
ncbi:type II toxin-antitoxin system Phd/YefM family antitoxin [Oscillochloris sp. ZM17-4]|uniref:type II toxin-antitoxin system Phd/YefM family antitoxin n=1 Tax=Oscillochloris sp. ZM17-4 TaxID=2866714 RepID=UPI001C72F7CA|nr:type II toxin-antitoxin system Phd/YefM family antitoxin [Oscillochloris sp. ZM17-4]MBX0330010.1 type II toxin-antitoxin system Phd/YefM family antitoxin [Oscillochloris sp. ZM17-4]